MAFDPEKEKTGVLELKYKIPYSDLTSITEEGRVSFFDEDEPITFGHTLQDQIGGQINAGFSLIGFYEDSWKGSSALHDFLPTQLPHVIPETKNTYIKFSYRCIPPPWVSMKRIRYTQGNCDIPLSAYLY